MDRLPLSSHTGIQGSRLTLWMAGFELMRVSTHRVANGVNTMSGKLSTGAWEAWSHYLGWLAKMGSGGLPAHVDHVEARREIIEADPVDKGTTRGALRARGALRLAPGAIGAVLALRN